MKRFLQCPACDSILDATKDVLGEQIRCQECGATFLAKSCKVSSSLMSQRPITGQIGKGSELGPSSEGNKDILNRDAFQGSLMSSS